MIKDIIHQFKNKNKKNNIKKWFFIYLYMEDSIIEEPFDKKIGKFINTNGKFIVKTNIIISII